MMDLNERMKFKDYVKKPFKIKAIQYFETNVDEIDEAIRGYIDYIIHDGFIEFLYDDGDNVICQAGDYVIIEEDTGSIYSVSESYFMKAFDEYINPAQTQLIQIDKVWSD